ncbi:DUF3826 domain-containing protein [Arachidicoccus sp.]|uniref:DUF3826 domain-containing protein n=1 Tax=Arachidicoccus sp. TaxID=1872624 RepID=UPI003D1BA0FD
MKKNKLFGKVFGLAVFCFAIIANTGVEAQTSAKDKQEIQAKAGNWVASLNLNDKAKEASVTNIIAAHLEAVRNWNNTHSYTTVPAGINPETGNKLSNLDRQIIVNSAMPDSVHQHLMNGLAKYLSPTQVEAILDKYTVGKVAFTFKGYEAIVPDLTDKEKQVILANLKTAREQAVDYKSMKQISAIFEIYKTKNEQYLNSNGRNWHQLYKDYVNKIKAEKAAKKSK